MRVAELLHNMLSCTGITPTCKCIWQASTSQSRQYHMSVSPSYMDFNSYIHFSFVLKVYRGIHPFIWGNPGYGNIQLSISSSHNRVQPNAGKKNKIYKTRSPNCLFNDYTRYVAYILDWATLPRCSWSVHPPHLYLLCLWSGKAWMGSHFSSWLTEISVNLLRLYINVWRPLLMVAPPLVMPL